MLNEKYYKCVMDANKLVNDVIRESNEFSICTPKVSFDDFSSEKWYIVLGISKDGMLRLADDSGVIKVVDKSLFLKERIKKETKKSTLN